MKANHSEKLQAYLRQIDGGSGRENRSGRDPGVLQHTNQVSQAIRDVLAGHEPQIEKKTKREPSIVPYETLDPLLGAYDTALEQRDEMLARADHDIDRLADLVECLVKENKALHTEISTTKSEYQAFLAQRGELTRRLYQAVAQRL